MAKRPTDYTAALQADETEQRERDKQRQALREQQASAYGAVVLTVAGIRLDVDQLAAVLINALDAADADPKLEEVWRQQGGAYFRRPPNTRLRKRAAQGDGDEANPPWPAAEPAPARGPRARVANLHGKAAPHQPSSGTSAKEGRHDGAS